MNPDTVRLILVRHGEVDANRSFQYLGRRDDELNEKGLGQAAALAAALSELDIDSVLASPLRRARETARAIAEPHGLVVGREPRLIELDFGSWDGRSRSEVVRESPEARIQVEDWEADPARSTPGGESLLDLQNRVVGLADELTGRRAGATMALVSHMGPIKTLLCAALGVPLGSSGRIFLDPATISVIDWGKASVVRLINSHSHLGFGNARWLQPR